jgi:hypothetical protein
VAGVTLVVLLGGAAAIRTAGGSDGITAPSASTATTTAAVTRQDLVLADSYDGALGFGESSAITANRAGVVTTISAMGSTVSVGQPIYTIDLQPTVLLRGAVPAFRTLDQNSEAGADIAQLEQALVDLGLGAGLTVDEDFTAATAAAVEKWEAALGRFDPDGTVALGDVIFTLGDLRVAEISAAVGTQVRADSTVLLASPTAKVVTMTVNADTANKLEAGTAVQLELPGKLDTTGKVTNIGPETTPAPTQGGGGSASTVTITISLDDPAVADAFDSGSVKVSVEQSRVKDATTVPVTALLALAEGGYAVQVADGSQPNGYRLVAVKIGTYSGDRVQVTGAGVEPGVKVVVPR